MNIHRSYRLLISRSALNIGLLLVASGAVRSQEPSAKSVLSHFCDADAKGEQLTTEGWRRIAAIFLKPGSPRRERVFVIRDFVIRDFVITAVTQKSEGTLIGNSASYYVSYTTLGVIESSQALFSPDPPRMFVEPSVFVVKQSAPGSNKTSTQVEQVNAWRIEGPVPEPHLNISAAISYATELRAKAETQMIRRNAERTLVALKRLRH
jgi:hypothetical protein